MYVLYSTSPLKQTQSYRVVHCHQTIQLYDVGVEELAKNGCLLKELHFGIWQC